MEKVFASVRSPLEISVAVARTSQSPFPLALTLKDRHDRQLTNKKIPTLRKIKRGVLPTHLPTQKHHI